MFRNILKVWVMGLFVTGFFIPAVVFAQGSGYKLFHSEDHIKKENPNKDKFYRAEIVTDKDGAKHLNGISCILPPASTGAKVAYHYHKNRESILFIISGQGIELLDGKEVPIKAGDVIYILPEVKHTIVNNSDKEIRYLEFFTHPPVMADFIEVK